MLYLALFFTALAAPALSRPLCGRNRGFGPGAPDHSCDDNSEGLATPDAIYAHCNVSHASDAQVYTCDTDMELGPECKAQPASAEGAHVYICPPLATSPRQCNETYTANSYVATCSEQRYFGDQCNVTRTAGENGPLYRYECPLDAARGD